MNCMKDSINVAIAGSTGYVGLELTKILAKPRIGITVGADKLWNFSFKI